MWLGNRVLSTGPSFLEEFISFKRSSWITRIMGMLALKFLRWLSVQIDSTTLEDSWRDLPVPCSCVRDHCRMIKTKLQEEVGGWRCIMSGDLVVPIIWVLILDCTRRIALTSLELALWTHFFRISLCGFTSPIWTFRSLVSCFVYCFGTYLFTPHYISCRIS